MQTQSRSSYRRSVLVLGTLLMFAAPTVACEGEPVAIAPDPRLGKEKRILFSSGCVSSVTMPVGATETITMQPPQENGTLPADLAPKSLDPTIIEVLNPSATKFDMHALKKGQTDIEVTSAGKRFDAITFHAEPAKVVTALSKPAIIAGGRTGIAISDVFGACGNEQCELFGHSFMKWSADPPSSFTFLNDTKNLASYTAGTTPGQGALLGHEPSEGQELVRFNVEVVDPATIESLSGTVSFTVNEEKTELALPATLPANSSSFEVRISGKRAGKSDVAISRHDITWTLGTGLSKFPQSEPSDPFAEFFVTNGAPGDYTFTAKVALLAGKEQQFVITVTPK